MLSTVTERGQTAIPAAIRKLHGLKPHTLLQWVDDGRSIRIVPIPADTIKSLRGKFPKGSLSRALAKSRQEERSFG